MASSTTYEKLAREDSDEEGHTYSLPHSTYIRSSWNVFILLGILITSNACTWFVSRTLVPISVVGRDRTLYASLERNIPTLMHGHDPYTDRNETFRDEMWTAINIDDGMVALPDEYVAEKGLAVSQRFPWDHTKGIYLLHGYHNLHCVRNIYIALMEFRQGKPQSRNWRHVIHCLDSLRRDVICNADDTPRLTTNDSIPETGHGQYRQCRSWDKLETWAKQYNSCYRYINETETPDQFPQIQRFVWCPEGSPYRAQVEELFDVEYPDA